MTPDLVNGLFELVGGVLLWLNVRRLWRDRRVAGVSAAPVVFWTAWGLWNLWFYPMVGCWWSFAGGLFVVAANAAWLVLLAIVWRAAFRRKALERRPCPKCGEIIGSDGVWPVLHDGANVDGCYTCFEAQADSDWWTILCGQQKANDQ